MVGCQNNENVIEWREWRAYGTKKSKPSLYGLWVEKLFHQPLKQP